MIPYCYHVLRAEQRRKYSAVYKFKPSSKKTRKVTPPNRETKIDKHNKSEGKI